MALFEPLYTSEEMKRAEAGHDVAVLMERAGRAVAERALALHPEARAFTAVCGAGANGGDGRIALRLLAEAGREAVETETLDRADVVIDAFFGTGFQGEPRPEAAALIERINESNAAVVSVDIPSGVDASTGEVPGSAVHADATVTMHGPKVGLHVAPGRFLAGKVAVVDIGLEHRETESRLVAPEILQAVPRKEPQDNKYTAGAVLVVGGAAGMTGAAALTARAAFRADAGYVAIAAPPGSLPVLETLVVEAVKRPLTDVDGAVKRASALALGPGLGREQAELVRKLLDRNLQRGHPHRHHRVPFERRDHHLSSFVFRNLVAKRFNSSPYILRERDMDLDLGHRLRSADGRIPNRIRGQLVVRDHEPRIIVQADERVGQADLFDLSGLPIDAHTIAEPNRLRNCDQDSGDEVRQRSLRGEPQHEPEHGRRREHPTRHAANRLDR